MRTMTTSAHPLHQLGAAVAAGLLMAGMLVAVLWASPGVAIADGCSTTGTAVINPLTGSYGVGQHCPGSSGSPGTSTSGQGTSANLDPNREVCFYRASSGEAPYHVAEPPPGQTAADGRSMDRYCGKASEIAAMQAAADPMSVCSAPCSGQYGVWGPNTLPPTPEEIATSLLASLDLTAPKIHTNPDKDRHLVVELPTWLWIDGDNSTQTASDGPISITARQTVRWSTDEGAVPCTGSGTPYVKGRSDPQKPSPDCGWTFSSPGAHNITAVVTWTVTVAGAAVTLPPSVFNVTQPVQVDEVQTVNR